MENSIDWIPISCQEFPAETEQGFGAGGRPCTGLLSARLGEIANIFRARLIHRMVVEGRVHDLPVIEAKVEALC